jgi:hypothetical protein
MRYLLTILLLAFSLPALAGDSGSYYDPDVDGQGMQLSRHGDTIQIFVYTYDDWQGCPGVNLPNGGLATPQNCSENRWFYSAGDTISKGDQQIEGWLYMGIGLNYPKGLPDLADPFKVQVGEGMLIGRYIMQRTLGINGPGWALVVIRFSNVLAKNDSLFSQVFDFNTLLFKADD